MEGGVVFGPADVGVLCRQGERVLVVAVLVRSEARMEVTDR